MTSLGLWLGWRLKRLAWPYYNCEWCVGQAPGTGCYCSNSDCVRPGTPPERWRRWLRKSLQFTGMDSL